MLPLEVVSFPPKPTWIRKILSLLILCGGFATVTMGQTSPPDTTAMDTAAMGATRGQENTLDTELSTVYFDANSVSLSPAAQRELNRLVRLMKAHPELIVNVFGHGDDPGSLMRIQELSELRAQMVKAFLISRGIPHTRIYSMGFGFRNPESPETTAEARAKNRRVEVHIDYYNHK